MRNQNNEKIKTNNLIKLLIFDVKTNFYFLNLFLNNYLVNVEFCLHFYRRYLINKKTI